MSFSLVNPLGWNTGDVLTEDQINDLDTDHANAVDGAGGGTYTLTAPLVFKGDNIEIDEDLTVGGDLDVDGVTTVKGFLADPAAIFEVSGNDVTISALVSVTGATCTLGSSTTSINSGTINIGNASGDAVALQGTTTFTAPFIGSGAGRIRPRVTLGGDANASYGPATADIVYVTTGTLTADRQYTISDTSAANGDCITFVNEQSNFHVEILNPSASTIGFVENDDGKITSYTFIRVSGTWRILHRSGKDAGFP